MLDHDRRDFSFRHSFANVLQYFNLSSNNFTKGSANISAVPTTSTDASLPSPRVKSSFPSQPTDRNTADDKSDVLESLLLAFSLIELFHLVCCSKDTYQRLTVFGYADIIILRVAGARFGGYFC